MSDMTDRIRALALLQELTGTKHALLSSSGAQALQIALEAAGVEPGDEVILAAFDTRAVRKAVESIEAVPVYADVLGVGTLNPSSVGEMLTPRTAAVVATHRLGFPAGVTGLRRVIGDCQIGVIEFAPHALGASLRGKPVGSMGDLACFSFGHGDMINAGGGGAIVTNNPRLARRASRATAPSLGRGKDSGRAPGRVPADTDLATQLMELPGRLKAVRDRADSIFRRIAEALDSVDWGILRPERAEPTWYRIPIIVVEHAQRQHVARMLTKVGIRAEPGAECDRSRSHDNTSLTHTRFLSHHLVLVDPCQPPCGTDISVPSSFHRK